ncbi:helix-turn-helix domain-containing protein [Corynebacterium timonense]|uniref:Helix-turn-helix domain-containing protein n=1 Tax=Corynebacterium timonense TaxID=441500 RepID=A0A1H1S628_9CORY|nr:helix-turn-helix transcriptional regulator [Corynebacterium timonense]SDS43431.1 Helix-turn-helix domain-containing protein [Corynebacterium timonense]
MADVLPESYWASYGYVLAVRLKTLRRMRGLTQRRLAELSGLSRSLISNLERNHYNSARSADPTLSTLYRIAHALHVPPAALLPGVGAAVAARCQDRPVSLSPLRVEWPQLPEDTARFDASYLLTGPTLERPPFALMLDSVRDPRGGAGAINAGC